MAVHWIEDCQTRSAGFLQLRYHVESTLLNLSFLKIQHLPRGDFIYILNTSWVSHAIIVSIVCNCFQPIRSLGSWHVQDETMMPSSHDIMSRHASGELLIGWPPYDLKLKTQRSVEFYQRTERSVFLKFQKKIPNLQVSSPTYHCIISSLLSYGIKLLQSSGLSYLGWSARRRPRAWQAHSLDPRDYASSSVAPIPSSVSCLSGPFSGTVPFIRLFEKLWFVWELSLIYRRTALGEAP